MFEPDCLMIAAMKRLLWVFVAILALDVALMVALAWIPNQAEPGVGDLSRPNLGFATFVALLVAAVLSRRGVLWAITLGMCVLGAVVFLASAISYPDEVVRWSDAAGFAIAATAVLGLRWTPPPEGTNRDQDD